MTKKRKATENKLVKLARAEMAKIRAREIFAARISSSESESDFEPDAGQLDEKDALIKNLQRQKNWIDVS